MQTSPLAPTQFPQMPSINGVVISTYQAHIAYKNRDDLLVIALKAGTSVAGVFTKSKTRSASVERCVKHLACQQEARLLVVNSGNSNAFTGRAGNKTVDDIITQLATKHDIKPEQVYTSSTGVIGELLSADKILNTIEQNNQTTHDNAFVAAANAIMTTDTFAKYATKTVLIGGEKVVINAIAKGSGMIAPDMATMLSYIFTDAKIPQDILQQILFKASQKSFNSITVDSDTSTSDTVLLFATGSASHKEINNIDDKALLNFIEAIDELCLEMAQQIVKDGEGAQKFITVNVKGATNDKAAHNIGLSIANSPLVKTAIAGEDANWGRIVMAVGKSGEDADRDLLEISIGDTKITQHGQVVKGYDEAPVTKHMQGQYIEINVDLGLKKGEATIYTCDLTHGYIEINADYRS